MKLSFLILSLVLCCAAGCAHPAGTLSGSGNGPEAGTVHLPGVVVFPADRFFPNHPDDPTGEFSSPATHPGRFLNQGWPGQARFFRVAREVQTDQAGHEPVPAEKGKKDESNRREGSAQGEGDQDQGENGEFTIADPLEPFNRAMFTFNDRLYFWVLKPVAQGYNKVVPETARVGVRNFFDNIKFPIRFVNNLLQANFEGAVSELGRFTVNTIWGIGGLLDPSSKQELAIRKYDADLGQTLGIYGVGQGFYIVYPVLGPSSARETVELVGDTFLDPLSYLSPWYYWIGTRAYEEVNAISLRIGDYESLTEAAIDPYLSVRDAFVQYREQKIRQSKSKTEPQKPGGVH